MWAAGVKTRDRTRYAAGGAPPEGIATIDIAIETLKVSEHLTPLLKVRRRRTTNEKELSLSSEDEGGRERKSDRLNRGQMR